MDGLVKLWRVAYPPETARPADLPLTAAFVEMERTLYGQFPSEACPPPLVRWISTDGKTPWSG
jgi:hypothetical protein